MWILRHWGVTQAEPISEELSDDVGVFLFCIAESHINFTIKQWFVSFVS